MANALYGKAKESLLSGEINLTSNTVKFLMVSSDYVVAIDTHEYVSDIGAGNIVARSGELDNKTVTLGVFDADNETVDEYGSSGFDYIILYTDSGVDATSRLLAYIDTADGLPVPTTTGTATVILQWSNEASKIFAL